ncbi:MAG: 3D domain-containing protein, partial [Clostridiales bacterium]
TFKHTVGDFLKDEGIVVDDNDLIDVAKVAKLKDNQKIKIVHLPKVNIKVDGTTLTITDQNITVAQALENNGIILDADDMVSPGLDTVLSGDMTIDVDRVETKEEVREMKVAYATEKKWDKGLEQGKTQILQEGKPGKQINTYNVTYKDGKIVAEKLIDSQTKEPTRKIMAVGSQDLASVGSAPKSGNYAPNGVKYKSKITATATAYTHDGSKTRMGTDCRVGAIAVDPNVIPLGTKLYVEGYGECTAEDTGGKIKGNRIDVFLGSESECSSWGVKDVTVYILE